MAEYNHSAFLRSEETRKKRTLEATYALAGSGLMLVVCVFYLINMVLKLIAGYLAGSIALSYLGDQVSGGAGILSRVILLVIAVISAFYACAFWRCYLGGKKKTWEKLIGGLKTLKVFITISLVMSCLTIFSDLASIDEKAMSFFSDIFGIVYYYFLRKTLCVLIENAEIDSFTKQIPACVPVLLIGRVVIAALTSLLERSELETAGLTAVNALYLLVSLLIAVCITLLLHRYRKLPETLS